MLKHLQRLLGTASPAPGTKKVERVQLATCALLLEIAHADSRLHDLEELVLQDLLQQKFDLPDQAVTELIALAQVERTQSPDLYHFAREINQNFSLEEKLEVMDGLWRLVYADGVLDRYEDALIGQIAGLLRLSHRQLIDAKLKALGNLHQDTPPRP
jgi:uncharacterized tellurite resistance protein B-like protein